MINCKAFYKAQTASCLKGNHSSFPSLRLWSKNFLAEINKNKRTFTFKVLQGCTSWGRQKMVQCKCFFWQRTETCLLCWKICKSVSFLAVLQEHIIFNVKWVEVHKMREVFRAKLYCKMNNPFRWFLLALTVSAKKSEIKKNSDDVHWIVWKNIKQLYTWKNVFKKIIPNNRVWIIYKLAQISFFGGLLYSVLASAFFSIFWHTFLLSPSPPP